MALVRSYRDLLVWQRAMDLVVEVYTVSKALPSEERFGLQSQSRRAAISVPANIAEGKGRYHLNEYLNHLSIANGSLKELETYLCLMVRLGYLEEKRAESALRQTEEIARMLQGLRKGLQHSSARAPGP